MAANLTPEEISAILAAQGQEGNGGGEYYDSVNKYGYIPLPGYQQAAGGYAGEGGQVDSYINGYRKFAKESASGGYKSVEGKPYDDYDAQGNYKSSGLFAHRDPMWQTALMYAAILASAGVAGTAIAGAGAAGAGGAGAGAGAAGAGAGAGSLTSAQLAAALEASGIGAGAGVAEAGAAMTAAGSAGGASLFNAAADSQMANLALGSDALAGYGAAGTGGVFASPIAGEAATAAASAGTAAAPAATTAATTAPTASQLSQITSLLKTGMSIPAVLATVMGAGAGAKGQEATAKTQIDPRLDNYYFGENGLLPSVDKTFKEQFAQGGLNDVQREGMNQQLSLLRDPGRNKGYQDISNTGAGLLGRPVAGNPFTDGRRTLFTPPAGPPVPQQSMGLLGQWPQKRGGY